MAVVLNPANVQGQTAADLFNPDAVQEIRLSINSRDLRDLQERSQENIYYTADLSWQGLRVRNAAVRSRGTGSRNSIKLGLRVDFDRYTSGQTFPGLPSLMLDNNWQDPSLLMRVTHERRGQSVDGTDLSPAVAAGWYVNGTWAVTGEAKAKGLDPPPGRSFGAARALLK
jgi:hypothetical protein